MYLPLLKKLSSSLPNIILWEIREMGLSSSSSTLPQRNRDEIEDYFVEGIKAMVEGYERRDFVFVGHSLGAYLLMLFLERYKGQYPIAKCILLSAVGVTPKEQDYKNKISGCGDALQFCFSKFAWALNLSYKDILKILWISAKKNILRNSLSKYGLV